MIPDAKIAEIRERADIAEIIGEYVTLRRAGANLKGVCPFHADTDPSFNVNPGRQFFHCFGCGVSGDLFSFVQRIEGVGFNDAVKQLAGRYNVELPEKPISQAARTAMEQQRNAAERRRYILEQAASFFEQQLRADSGKPARELLHQRRIDPQIAEQFRLGYAPDNWSGLLDHLGRMRIAPQELAEVGLVLARRSGGFYDRFRHRLMFTITDAAGRPIAFSGRALDEGQQENTAKYINSPETPEYTKGKTLYGLYQARVPISKQSEVVMVEGNFDVVATAQAGVMNVVAPLGTALTEEQALLLRRRAERVVIVFDGDKAGRAAAARAFPILAKVGLAGYIAPLPPGEDPDSFVRHRGAEAFEQLLANRKGLLDQIIADTAEQSDRTVQDIARRVQRLKPLLDALRGSMERDLYCQRIAQAFQIEQKSIYRYLRGHQPAERPTDGPSIQPPASPPGRVEERELLGLLMDQPGLIEQSQSDGIVGMVTTPALRTALDKLVADAGQRKLHIGDFIEKIGRDGAGSWIAKRALTCLYQDEEVGGKALVEIKAKLASARLTQQIHDVEQQIQNARMSGDDSAELALLNRKAELQREKKGKQSPVV